MSLPERVPPLRRLNVSASIFGRPPRRTFNDQAADVIRLLVDLIDLLGDVRHVLLRHDTVASGLVELHRDADRVAVVPFNLQAVDLHERPLNLSMADNSFLHIARSCVTAVHYARAATNTCSAVRVGRSDR